MTRVERLRWLGVAVAIAAIALVLHLSSSNDGSGKGSRRTATTATSPRPAGRPAPPVLHAGTVARLTAKRGDLVTFLVRAPAGEEVHVHGYDRKVDVPASGRVRVAFRATIVGVFEIELEHASTQLARLEVDP